jgi:SAM-dependent methyltransferase
MPTLDVNKQHWDDYDWPQGGEEWSVAWGGSEYVWYAVLLPRLLRFLPTSRALEIAPGFGRWTQYLKELCDDLTVVDLAAQCIAACQRRFAESHHITYHVNDGLSLAMVPAKSIDFVFSYDSLVHAEAHVLESYLRQLAEKLAADGVGFIHHSNLAAIVPPTPGAPPPDIHWRAHDMSATLFVEYCAASGLRCIAQEIVDWGGHRALDCFSVFTLPGSRFDRPLQVHETATFMAEAERLKAIARLYGAPTAAEAAAPEPPPGVAARLARWLRRRQ